MIGRCLGTLVGGSRKAAGELLDTFGVVFEPVHRIKCKLLVLQVVRESSARGARAKILVHIYIYIYIFSCIPEWDVRDPLTSVAAYICIFLHS